MERLGLNSTGHFISVKLFVDVVTSSAALLQGIIEVALVE